MKDGGDTDAEFVLWLLAVGLAVAVVLYVVAALPLLIWTGVMLSPVDGVATAIRLIGHTSQPRDAYAGSVAARMPGAVAWWTMAGAGCTAVVVGGIGVVMRADRWRGRRRLGLRPYDPRRHVVPRSFARPRDLRSLHWQDGGDSWSLLRVDRRDIGTGPESHVLAIGPPRSGKSMALATPWIVEAPGPVVSTSTKRELVGLTHACRARAGPCWVYAPLVPAKALPVAPASWSPLPGCEEWDTAQLAAHWMNDAGARGGAGGEEGAAARFWNAEAAKLLGALMHAAAMDPERFSMASVVGWVDGGADGLAAPLEVARAAGHADAARRIEGLCSQDARTLSSTLISAGQLVGAYRLLAAQASERAGPAVDVDALLEGDGTLYLLAPESRQAVVAPLFAALLGRVFHAIEARALTRGPADPPVRFVLDEAAHLAALSSLPERLSVTAGQGVRIASLWQSYAQVRHRFGAEADTVVASSHARLVLGPVVDEATRKLVSDLLDDEPAVRRTRRAGLGGGMGTSLQEVRQRKASAQSLQQLERWRGLAVVGSELPMVGRVRPWWERPAVRRRVDDGG